MSISIIIDQKEQGPYSIDQVKQLLVEGRVLRTDLAWREGMQEWQPLVTFPEFADAPQKVSKPKKLPQGVILSLILGAGIVFWGGVYLIIKGKSPPTKPNEDTQARSGASTMHASPVGTNSIPAINLAGLPRTFADLNRWYENPTAGENGAPALLEACDQVRIDIGDRSLYTLPVMGRAKLPIGGMPFDSKVKQAMNHMVRQNATALDKMGKAGIFSQCRYPVDLSQGALVVMPHLPKIEIAAKLAGMAAIFYADTQQPEQAGQMILFCLALAHSLEYEPTWFSQYTRMRCDVIALNCLSQVLNRTMLSQACLDRLQKAINQSEDMASRGTGFTRGLAGERVRGLALFELAPEVLLKEIAPPAKSTAPANQTEIIENMKKHAKEDRAFLDEAFGKCLAARNRFKPGGVELIDAMAKLEAQWERKRQPLFISNVELSFIVAVGKVEPMLVAHIRLADVAIALERYRLQNRGQYPESLQSLKPRFLAEIPLDPFTGSELGYSKKNQGYKVECSKPAFDVSSTDLDYSFAVIVPPSNGG